MIHVVTFAPALEHSYGSNEKQNDCADGENLQQHHNSLVVRTYGAGLADCSAVTRITRRGMS